MLFLANVSYVPQLWALLDIIYTASESFRAHLSLAAPSPDIPGSTGDITRRRTMPTIEFEVAASEEVGCRVFVV